MPASFELVMEAGDPVAALVSKEVTDKQLWIVYGLLPQRSFCQWELAKRWNVHRVLATNDWASDQAAPEADAPAAPDGQTHLRAMKLSLDIQFNKAKARKDFNTVAKIIELVCEKCHVTPAQLESTNKRWAMVWPRFLAIYLIRKFTYLSSEKVGLLFNRDHAAVLHAVKKVDQLISVNDISRSQLEDLELTLSARIPKKSVTITSAAITTEVR